MSQKDWLDSGLDRDAEAGDSSRGSSSIVDVLVVSRCQFSNMPLNFDVRAHIPNLFHNFNQRLTEIFP